MPQNNDITQLSLEDFIESLYNELPKELQTNSVKANLTLQANDIMMEEISEYMSAEDLEDTLKMSQEMGIPMDNVLETYLTENPQLLENITDSLNQFAQFTLNFAANG
ncbi:hypothetical protein JW752_01895 [Candidatus Peregrinibacteria bacterium]|nr:hypothetical protein [Candidatus Peregrinibacteria bacterium]